MQARITLVIVLLGLVFGCQQPIENRRDQEAIQALVDRIEAANNAGDVDAWVSCFASDFAYLPPNLPPITQRDSLVEIARAGFRNHASIRITPIEFQVCRDWAFSRSHVSGTVELHDSGDVVSLNLKQLVIYHRNSQGVWKISRLMINSNS